MGTASGALGVKKSAKSRIFMRPVLGKKNRAHLWKYNVSEMGPDHQKRCSSIGRRWETGFRPAIRRKKLGCLLSFFVSDFADLGHTSHKPHKPREPSLVWTQPWFRFSVVGHGFQLVLADSHFEKIPCDDNDAWGPWAKSTGWCDSTIEMVWWLQTSPER